MESLFIPKIMAGKYVLGSFDVYQELSKQLIMENSKLSSYNAMKIIDSIPEEYRAAIVDRDRNYVGFIGLYNIDKQNHVASIRLELNHRVTSNKDRDLILQKYKKWVDDFLHLPITEEITCISCEGAYIDHVAIDFKPLFTCFNRALLPGISIDVFEKFSREYNYDIPNLQFSFSIQHKGKILGIIGLSDINWISMCAKLNLFLAKEVDHSVFQAVLGDIINDYLEYVHSVNIHNVSFDVSGNDNNMLAIIASSDMSFYGEIPFAVVDGNNLVSRMMFQHLPEMQGCHKMILPDTAFCKSSLFNTNRHKLEDFLLLNRGYKLVQPSFFIQKKGCLSSIFNEYLLAMLCEDNFSRPLARDHYMFQSHKGKYSLYQSLMDSTYILLDYMNHYCGFVNLIRNDSNNKNVEVEIGIVPLLQHNGIGSLVLNKIYEELFSIGYASVTTKAFSFHIPSLKINSHFSEFSGIQLESYYMDGKLWNIHFFTKINDFVSLPDLKGKSKCMIRH